MSKLYEVRVSHEKGLGIFATKNISHGAQIMADECALSVPEQHDRQNNPIETHKAFVAMYPDQQSAYLRLTYNSEKLQQYV